MKHLRRIWKENPVQVRCPKCERVIDAEEINVSTDVAMCRACNEAFSLPEALDRERAKAVDLDRPPKGACFERTFDGFIIGAMTRSSEALRLSFFALVLSVLGIGILHGIHEVTGEFQLPVSLFAVPFLLAAPIIWAHVLMCVCGKVKVAVEGARGEVFAGIGSLGRTKRFNWLDISDVRKVRRPKKNHLGTHNRIVIEENRQIQFGYWLRDDRQDFMLQVLRKMLAERES